MLPVTNVTTSLLEGLLPVGLEREMVGDDGEATANEVLAECRGAVDDCVELLISSRVVTLRRIPLSRAKAKRTSRSARSALTEPSAVALNGSVSEEEGTL